MKIITYTYSKDGYITRETSIKEGTETERSYTYSDRGELSSFTEKEGEKTTVYTYGYDIRGNWTKLTIEGNNPEPITYKYDSADCLIEKDSSKEGKTLYAYDENGKLTSEKQSGKLETI